MQDSQETAKYYGTNDRTDPSDNSESCPFTADIIIIAKELTKIK